MATFDLEQIFTQMREEFAKKEVMIQELASRNKLLLQLHTKIQRATCSIPVDLRRSSDAVTDGNIIVLRRAETNELYEFNKQTGENTSQIQCLYLRCSLVMYKGVLITIGGAISKDQTAQCSNKLIGWIDNQWQEAFPPMPTKRSRTTALTFGTGDRYIIVIGGEDENHEILTTIEILDTETKTWYKVQDLPEPRCCSSGTIVNQHIYILGGWRGDDPVSSVLKCSVEDLINSANQPLGRIWKQLPKLPVEEAVCTSFNNNLLIVGGRANKEPVQEIRTYNSFEERWEVIEYLQKRRYICFAIGLDDRLIVIGGRTGATNTENTMEILYIPQ